MQRTCIIIYYFYKCTLIFPHKPCKNVKISKENQSITKSEPKKENNDTSDHHLTIKVFISLPTLPYKRFTFSFWITIWYALIAKPLLIYRSCSALYHVITLSETANAPVPWFVVHSYLLTLFCLLTIMSYITIGRKSTTFWTSRDGLASICLVSHAVQIDSV